MTDPYFNVNVSELLENQVINVDSGNRIINNNPDVRYTHRRDKKIMMKLSIEDVMDHGLLYVTLQDIKLPLDNNGVKSLGEFDIGALTIDLNTKKITEFTLDTEEFELLQLTEEDKRKMLKGLGRKMLLLALEIQAVLPREMIRKYKLKDANELGYIPKRTDTSLANAETLVKMGFKPRSWSSGIFYQSVKYLKSTIKDSLRESNDSGFAPVATGSYGCVFYPRLLTFRERRNADRGTALVSKVFHDPDDAWNEWDEQVNIKERLRPILLSDDEELRYIFATGEPSRIGTQLAAGDLRGPDGKTIANTCTNFPNGIIEPDFLKLDIANAGRDLKYWMTPQVVTPDLVRDILYRFSRPGGLLDSIRLMNQQGVLHGDIKWDNLTMKEDGETISIIDWGLAYHPGMEWRIDDPWPQPMPLFQYNIPAVSLLFKSEVRARMALSFRNPPSRQGWFNYNTGVLDRDELIQLFWPIVRDDIFDGTNERDGHIFQLEKDFETIARFSEEHMTDVIDTDLMTVINNDQTLSAGFVNPPLISKRAREYASVVINQLIHIYQTNPSWFDPLNDEGLRNYWHNVYLYNADIWGAMNVILKIVDIIKNDPDYETSDTTHLVHALNMTVMLPDSQSSPINIEDLKALLMTYGDSIGDGYVFDEDDEDDDIDIIYEEDSEEESENSYYDPDDFVVDDDEDYYDIDEYEGFVPKRKAEDQTTVPDISNRLQSKRRRSPPILPTRQQSRPLPTRQVAYQNPVVPFQQTTQPPQLIRSGAVSSTKRSRAPVWSGTADRPGEWKGSYFYYDDGDRGYQKDGKWVIEDAFMIVDEIGSKLLSSDSDSDIDVMFMPQQYPRRTYTRNHQLYPVLEGEFPLDYNPFVQSDPPTEGGFRFSEDGGLWAVTITDSWEPIFIRVNTNGRITEPALSYSHVLLQQELNQQYVEPINWIDYRGYIWAVYESEDDNYPFEYLRLSGDPNEEFQFIDPRSMESGSGGNKRSGGNRRSGGGSGRNPFRGGYYR